MKHLNLLVVGLALTTLFGVQPAQAFGCDTDSNTLCTLPIQLAEGAAAAVRAPGTQFNFIQDGSGYEITGDIELLANEEAASGMVMAGAVLVVEYNDPSQPHEGFRRLRGSAELVINGQAQAEGFGTLGAEGEIRRRVDLGIELGTVLRDELGFHHLNPDRPCEGKTLGEPGYRECPYWVFRYLESERVGLGYGGTDVGVQIDGSAENKDEVVLLVDPQDLFIYTGFSRGAMDSVTLNIESTADPKEDPESFTNAQRGIGFSQHGYIPFNVRTDWGIEEHVDELGLNFNGHLVIDWHDLPLGPWVKLDGSYVVKFPVDELDPKTIEFDSHFQLAGNGDLRLNVPMAQGVVKLDMNIGEATAGMKVTEDEQLVFISGLLDADFPWEPEGLPVQLDYRNNYQVAAVLANQFGGDDTPDFTHSFVHIQGEYLFDLNIGSQSRGLGGSVGATGLLKANFDTGFEFKGTMGDSVSGTLIHPLIQAEREVALHVVYDPANRAQQWAELTGEFAVGQDTFSQQGILRIGHDEAYLGFPVDFNPNLLQDAYEDLQTSIQAAEDNVRKLDDAIAKARAQVQAEKDKQQAGLTIAQAEVDKAQASVNKINANISRYYSQISSYRRSITWWYNWYKRQHWTKRAGAYAKYLSRKAYYNGLIAVRYSAIVSAKVAKGVATLTLTATKGALELAKGAVNLTPVDADPRVASLFVLRDPALLTLNGLQALMPEIPRIPGRVNWTAGFVLADGKVTPENRTEYCFEDQCTQIKGGTFDAKTGEACIDFPEMGLNNICITLGRQT